MPVLTLHDLLISELSDALGADRQLLNAWPALAVAASADSLEHFCDEGIDYTRARIKRLETVFEILKAGPIEKISDGMTCLIESALDVADNGAPGSVRDARLLAAMQKLSHYGHASYDSLVGYAETLGRDEIAKILRQSLDEKSEAIAEMTELAKSELNPKAERASK